jgi:hypothetical protein
VILLNDIVEILARANLDGPQLSTLGAEFAHGPMGGLVPIERDGARRTRCVFESLAEERFGGGDVTLGAQAKINRLAAGIDGAESASSGRAP